MERRIFPHALVRCTSRCAADWKKNLHLLQSPGPVLLAPDARGQIVLTLDFGTELDGVLELEARSKGEVFVMASFGESEAEAEEWGIGNRSPWHIIPKEKAIFPASKKHCHRFVQRGFRFVKLHFFDVSEKLDLQKISVDAFFTFEKKKGHFQCSDTLFQKLWQSSTYTARLCARPDDFWDGVKRDRWGWFGDARIIKETCDAVFFAPEPSEAMIARLETEKWANGIPNFSFDCVAMLKHHLLTFGLDRPGLGEMYARAKSLLDWAIKTQTDRDGFFVRCESVDYFFKVGFVDWSPLPDGGRFEELCCLQCSFAEALADIAQIAGWLGKKSDQKRFALRAETLREKICRKFWNPKRGFEHTLNVCEKNPVWSKERNGGEPHYRGTYLEGKKFGPSGPSRQANARAVWAGVATDEMKKKLLHSVFLNPRVPSIITTYYTYYEQMARAECGDPAGALLYLRNYLGEMLDTTDSTTIWEWFDPSIRGIEQWELGGNPQANSDLVIAKSLCHGWGSGTVGIAQKHLLGVEPLAPGYSKVRLRPETGIPWTFEASIPTPHGPIRVKKEKSGIVRHSLPKGIKSI